MKSPEVRISAQNKHAVIHLRDNMGGWSWSRKTSYVPKWRWWQHL